MAEAIVRMEALVSVREGMRVYCDCPHMSTEDFETDNFFRKYSGKSGVIAGFVTTFVGPLDSQGRLPGVYFKSDRINVKFDGEEQVHESLNLKMFVLLDVAATVASQSLNITQRVGDLPHPILFYPGDTVTKKDDLHGELRLIESISIKSSGEIIYILAETTEKAEKRAKDRQAELQRDRANRKSDLGFRTSTFDIPQTEACSGEDLSLVLRGNLYHLYQNEPDKLVFKSVGDEILFWGQDGLSKTVLVGGQFDCSLENARAALKRGAGDLIVGESERLNKIFGSRNDRYSVRSLYSCFEAYRDRVHSLALKLRTPPVQGRKTLMEKMKAFLGDED